MKYNGQEFCWPVKNAFIRNHSLSNSFGAVRKNADGTPRVHQGWDFFAEEGTPVYSVGRGHVVFAGDRGKLGHLIVIHHEVANIYSAYAHLSLIKVGMGEVVEKETPIGKSGTTGNAKGMKGSDQHLHFEFRTEALPGTGLDSRISPIIVFSTIPLGGKQ